MKEFSDLIIETDIEELEEFLGPDFINAYIEVSKIIDCGVLYKNFIDMEIDSKISLLINKFEEISEENIENLKNSYPNLYASLVKIKTENTN